MGKSLFDHLKQITDVQNPKYWDTLSESDIKTWSTYMIVRYLSMNPEWTDLVAMVQPYIDHIKEQGVRNLPEGDKYVYKILLAIIPKEKKFLKYMKAKGSDKYEKWLVDLFAKHYEISKLEVEGYLHILYSSTEGKRHIIDICERYGTDSKDIKKLKLKV